MHRTLRNNQTGVTLLEMLIAVAILAMLASVVLPLAEITVKRTKEVELRRALREIRTAIDNYKSDFDRAVEEKKIIPSLNDPGYPEDLDALIKGNDWGGLYPYKRYYLRRIPKDPFDPYGEGWGLRSYSDDPDSTVWGGENVYDVFSTSDGMAIDGTPYQSW